MQPTRSKFVSLAGALALAALCGTAPVLAQNSVKERLQAQAKIDANATPALTSVETTLLQAHKTDLEAIIKDLSRVQTPAAAKEYEPYLAAQLPKYLQNHKDLHDGYRESLGGRLAGAALRHQQALVAADDNLHKTHFWKLASEMDRVERLNLGLKKSFDALRSLA